MIDFRYHLVSIVAVFLALAIGIVLGSTELQGPAYNLLDKTTSKLQNELGQVSSHRVFVEAVQTSLCYLSLRVQSFILIRRKRWHLVVRVPCFGECVAKLTA